MISKDPATKAANRVIPGWIVSEIESAIWCLIVHGESDSMKNTLSDDGTEMHAIAELGDIFFRQIIGLIIKLFGDKRWIRQQKNYITRFPQPLGLFVRVL